MGVVLGNRVKRGGRRIHTKLNLMLKGLQRKLNSVEFLVDMNQKYQMMSSDI